MLEPNDIISGLVGFLLFAVGLLPILSKFNVGPDWFSLSFLPVTVITWILAVGALYLVIDSVIEITNSSPVGIISVILAFLFLTIGVLPVLHNFGIGPSFFSLDFLGGLGDYLYYGVCLAEGLFLMIAMFAMEM